MERIILYDGICNLCSSLVSFIKRHDRLKRFRFVALQSTGGKIMLTEAGLPEYEADTVLYLKDKLIFSRSDAVLNILRDMGGAWSIFYVLIIIPPLIRDFAYRLVSRSRYVVFGRKSNCDVNGDSL